MKKILTVGILFLNIFSYAQNLSTFSGSGIAGFRNGPSTSARFLNPEQIAIDSVGNVFVADSDNNRIRKIAIDGTVSTYAGTGGAGDLDTTRLLAQFNFPLGIAFDQANNLYVVDNGNAKIKVIKANGKVETIAGTRDQGFRDGPALSAQFNRPVYICIDKESNIYVADNLNHRIRKIDQLTDSVYTIAGNGIPGFTDGIAVKSQLNSPRGIAVDDQFNVYVGDQENHAIRKISPQGDMRTLAGDGIPGFADGSSTNARFNGPKGISIDRNGNIYVADRLNYLIRKIDTLNNVTTVAGLVGQSGFTNGDTDIALIGRAVDVEVLNSNNVLVSDWQNDVIRKIQLSNSLSIEQLKQGEQFNFYPNPVSDHLIIKGEFGNQFEVFIFDIKGSLVLHKRNQYRLDLQSLQSGQYLVHIKGKKYYGLGKIVKQ